jgi:ElaB/YqjD/DUF883 family membrane-anchored ribosome-binding protein
MHKTTLAKRKTHPRALKRAAHALRSGIRSARALHSLKASINGVGDDFSDKATKIVAKSIRKARVQSKRVGRYVTKKPYRSLGFAAIAACLFIGYLANK